MKTKPEYMAKTLDQKKEIVAKIEGALKGAASAVFVHFSKITVAEESQMRRALRAESVGYTVAKKTLIHRALESLGHKHDDIPMAGELAVAYGGNDETAVARLVHEFGKKFTDKLSILGGIFEGKIVGAAAMQAIATIPPMAVLRGMFAQILNSPRSRFAIALSEVAKTKN